ncbi:endonuclease domain-containing protein [Dialister sp.]|uniref:endonuclease domain-containing protein n=1 Tax=Dialister sp. TaxID=1955814 RepID=UPI002E813E78|nr:endonuclease domain-containing protein [Dialister sp.]MEE3453675.1 endonuclease domain-containing protein [Dialister sp.]
MKKFNYREWLLNPEDDWEQVEGLNMPVSEEMKKRRMELRKNMTPEENHLWRTFFLPYKKMGIHFIHQKVIGHYIVDFFYPKTGLIIEIDGGQHFTEEGRKYDAERTRQLQNWGFEIRRYSNLTVHQNFEGVCQDIINKVNEMR